MKAYTVYTKNNCPFCTNAKTLLGLMHLSFHEINVEGNAEATEFVKNQWALKGKDKPTVPLVIENATKEVIGGYDELLVHLT